MTKIKTVILTWKLAAPLGFFWRLHQLVRSILIPYHKLLYYLPSGGTLLDLGCGHGIFLALAKLSNPHLRVSGIDLSPDKINGARLIFNAAKIKAANIDVLDVINFTQQSVDAISAIDVFYLVPKEKWNSTLNQCYNSLKPGGRILLKEMDKTMRWKFYLLYLQEMLAVKILGFTMSRGKFTFPVPEEIKSILERIGFKKIEINPLDSGYYIPHKLWIGHK